MVKVVRKHYQRNDQHIFIDSGHRFPIDLT